MRMKQIIKVIIPARDEAASIALVVEGFLALRDESGAVLIDQVIVSDNGSKDNTAALARQAGAHVVSEPIAGYGRACLTAMAELGVCDWVLFCDGDNAFETGQAIELLKASKQADLVIGSRVLGRREAGALTPPQIFGNHLAAFLISLFWGVQMTDLGPYRLIRKEALDYLRMQDEAFGWTVEMQIKAIQCGLVTHEVAVNTRCRLGYSKISGTLKGTVGAAIGIFGMIAKLWWQEEKTRANYQRANKDA